jgi:hypothetical protein
LASCSAFNQNATFCSILILYYKYRQRVKEQDLWFLSYMPSRNTPRIGPKKLSSALCELFPVSRTETLHDG